MSVSADKLQGANELAAVLESSPMVALGVALMDEDMFWAVALRAKRLLAARATQAGYRAHSAPAKKLEAVRA